MTPKQAAELLLEFRAAIEAEGSTYTAEHAEAVVMACEALERTPTSGSGMLSEEEREFVEAWRKGRPVLPETWERGATKFLAIVDRLTADLASARALLGKVSHDRWSDGACCGDCLACERDAHLAGSGGAKEEAKS